MSDREGDPGHVIEVRRPDGSVERLRVRGRVEVGRETGDLVVADPAVSRRHLLIDASGPELTVSDLVEILGQSQPRVSRHLRLLVEAGLLTRHQEGNWAFYRLNEAGESGELARLIADLLPDVLVKGEDWRDKGVVGREWVESHGGRVVLVPLREGCSTTAMIERIRRS